VEEATVDVPSSIDALPDEIALDIIVAAGDARSIAALSATSKRYYRLATDDHVWRRIYESRFGPRLHQRMEAHGKSWRWLYQACAAGGHRPGAVVGRLRVKFAFTRAKCVYWGDVEHGLPHGYGLAISLPTELADPDALWPVGGSLSQETRMIYEGWWNQGYRQGHGKTTWGGSAYEGEHASDRFCGQGILCWDQGTCRYQGGMKDDKFDGEGIYTCSDGSRYHGIYRDGHAHGWGVYTWPANNEYRGHHKKGHRHGYGTLKLDGGRIVYVGHFDRGVAHGLASKTEAGVGIFKGQFKHGNREGWGLYVYADDGSRLWGKWSKGTCVRGEVVDHGTRVTPCTGKSRCRACAGAPRDKSHGAQLSVAFLESL
jgi:hypothetical protein